MWTGEVRQQRLQQVGRWLAGPRTARPVWLVLAGTAVAAGLALLSYLWAHLYVGLGLHQFDLHIYFNSVQYWAAGHNIYDYSQYDPVQLSLGFTYPPLSALLMRPMAWLSWPAVVALTVSAIIVATAACSYLCIRERVPMRGRRLLFAAALTTVAAVNLEPIRQTIDFGQINMFLMVLVLADVLVLCPRASRWAGVGIGLAMAVKLTPGVFLLYLVLARNWRATATACLTAAVATLGAAALMPVQTWEYFTKLLWESSRVGFLSTTSNQSLRGFIARLGDRVPAGSALWLVALGIVAVVAVLRIRRAVRENDALAAVTMTGLLGVLASPVSWVHHIVWVLPAMIILLYRLIRAGTRWDLLRKSGIPARRADLWRALFAPALLFVLGAVVWGSDLRATFLLPNKDYAHASLLAVFQSGSQMFWIIAVMALLPIGRALSIRPFAGVESASAEIRMRSGRPGAPTAGQRVGWPARPSPAPAPRPSAD